MPHEVSAMTCHGVCVTLEGHVLAEPDFAGGQVNVDPSEVVRERVTRDHIKPLT